MLEGPDGYMCGDGIVNGGEICDEGPGNGLGDGYCTADCMEIQTCADGQVQGTEGCDDGNMVDDCVCLGNCQLPYCGDGLVCGAEACDDMGQSSTCDSDCTPPTCGDGVQNVNAGEVCDEGPYGTCSQFAAPCNTSANCPLFGTCTLGGFPCLTDAECGWGFCQGYTNAQTCVINIAEGECLPDCSGYQICGDGVTSVLEECDDGAETPTCDSNCTAAACGDGHWNASAGEICDEGSFGHCSLGNQPCNVNGDCPNMAYCNFGGYFCDSQFDPCGFGTCSGWYSQTCIIDGGDGECLSNCSGFQTCGNGVVEGSETCDDSGNSAACDGDCSAAVCGDGYPNPAAGEFCDDGAPQGEGLCTNDCQAVQICGDTVTNGTEACDDGVETENCDGDCTLPTCGDGRINLAAREQCEAGYDLSLLSDTGTPGASHAVDVQGSTAYVADGDSGLLIFDVGNPASPVLLGSYDTPGFAQDVAVRASRAYLADGDSGLQIIDVSIPTAPVLLGSYDTAGSALGVAVGRDVAFVTDYWGGLKVINVNNPTAPVLMGSHVGSIGQAWGVDVSEGYIYVADAYYQAMWIFDAGNPYAPAETGVWSAPFYGYPYDVSVKGTRAFVADLENLEIINVSNPASPSLLGSSSSGVAEAVKVQGNAAFVADNTAGMRVYDVSNPAAPSHLMTLFNYSYSNEGVQVSGGTAYHASGDLEIIDIADNCSDLCRNPVCGDGIIDIGEDCDDGFHNGMGPGSCLNDCLGTDPITDECDPDCPKFCALSGLVAWWDLNSDALDRIKGQWLLPNANTTWPATGAVSNAISFNNNNGAAIAQFTPMTGLKDFTVEFWYQSNDTDGAIFSASDTDGISVTNDNEFLIYKINANQITVWIKNIAYGMPTTAPLGGATTWHHLAVTRAGGTLSLYIDGLLQSTAAVTTAALGVDANGNDGAIVLAQEQDCAGSCFDAAQAFAPSKLDEISIYKRALRASEIAFLRQHGTTDTSNYRCAPSCGNGYREAGEWCDDGNLINGDGCSNTCQSEIGCGFAISSRPYFDISATATNSGIVGDDTSGSLPIGFNFNYYGNVFSSVTVETNGYVSFDGPSGVYTNEPIPSVNAPNNMLAPFWDDLFVTGGTGRIYYQTSGLAGARTFVVQWDHVDFYGLPGADLNFQMVLHEGSNIIEYRYGVLTEPGASATVGYERQGGSAGQQYSYNTPFWSQGLSLMSRPNTCAGL